MREIGAALFDAATVALTLTVDHMMMIGCGLAEERLAWFLTVRRCGWLGQIPRWSISLCDAGTLLTISP
jgi:hypothetical protein